jgi:hypothetical protein
MVKYLTMIIPSIQGEFNQNEFFIYSAADEKYFDEFVPALANSIKFNTPHTLHLHLYNPRPDQIEFCKNKKITFTYEEVDQKLFLTAAKKFEGTELDKIRADQKLRTTTAMSKSNDQSIQERLQKTYFACSRFIVLKKFLKPGQQCLAIDVDAIVRSSIPMLSNKDFFIHYISGKKSRFLAGGIFYTEQTSNFLEQYGLALERYLHNDDIYWGLDQDVLEKIVPNYNWGQLPIGFIDWDMRPESYIWTAKGKRKDLEIFINEQKKYNS